MSGSVLIISERCEYCTQTLQFIQDNPILIPLIKIHNIDIHGVPKGVAELKRVPSILSSDGKLHVGLECIRWLEMNVPSSFGAFEYSAGSNYDEPFDGVGDGFPLDSYGISLSPMITPSIQRKIDKPIKDAYDEMSLKK